MECRNWYYSVRVPAAIITPAVTTILRYGDARRSSVRNSAMLSKMIWTRCIPVDLVFVSEHTDAALLTMPNIQQTKITEILNNIAMSCRMEGLEK